MKNPCKEFGKWVENTTNLLFSFRLIGYFFYGIGIVGMILSVQQKDMFFYIATSICLVLGSFLLAGSGE